MNVDTFVFDSVKAAQEVAYMLRGNWDGCNSIELTNQSDKTALKLAASICSAQYCQAEKTCNIASDCDDNGEDDRYQQTMFRAISDFIESRSNSRIVTVEQKPEQIFSSNKFNSIMKRKSFWQL